jgi:predicted RNA polymerase sigma factor
MSASTGQHTELVLEVGRRRAQLRVAMGELEHALAVPAAAASTARWGGRLADALTGLYREFAQHVAITEGSEGLHRDLADQSPRLARTIERLAAEHVEITRRLEELLTWVDLADEWSDVSEARRAGTDLLAALIRHRQHGADLVFEVYGVDLGGET